MEDVERMRIRSMGAARRARRSKSRPLYAARAQAREFSSRWKESKPDGGVSAAMTRGMQMPAVRWRASCVGFASRCSASPPPPPCPPVCARPEGRRTCAH